MKYLSTLLILTLLLSCKPNTEAPLEKNSEKEMTVSTVSQKLPTLYKSKEINGLNIFYRESGDASNPTVILLHGFPSSSHQYRKVLEELSDSYHLIAPDYPGFGESDYPSKEEFTYTFDNIASTMDAFVQSFELEKYSLMIQDYGAPVGFRIATTHPEKVTAIINQNGNAYEAGLGDAWAGVRDLWKEDNKKNRDAILPVFSKEGMKWQYTHGTRNPETVNPDTWNLDYARISRPGAHEINLDLFYDYQNNVKLYPQWQQYLRDNQPPMLIVWGKNDAFFPEPGAAAFKKDLKDIDYNIYDTGHFALEEEGDDILKKMRAFLNKVTK